MLLLPAYFSRHVFPNTLLICAIALLSACGASSSGPDSGGTSSGASLSNNNVAAVSAETLAVTGSVIDGLLASPGMDDLGLVSSSQSSGSAVSSLAATTFYCGDGTQGSYTLEVGVDGLILQFQQCLLGTVTLDGAYTLSAIEGDITACPGKFAFHVTVSDFELDDGMHRTRLMGAYDYSLVQEDTDIATAGCETQIQTFSGASLVMDVDGVRSELSDFAFTDTINTDTYQREYQASLSSDAAGGVVTARTTSPIMGNLSERYPSSGTIEIGDGTAIATITIQSSNPTDDSAVLIELDSDADGTVDDSQSYSWETLDALYTMP